MIYLYQHLPKSANWFRLQGVNSPSLRVYRVVWRPSSQRLPVTPSMLWDVPPYQHLGNDRSWRDTFWADFWGPNFGTPPPFFRNDTTLGTFFRKCWGFTNCLALIRGPYLHDFLNARTWLWDSEGGAIPNLPSSSKKKPTGFPVPPFNPFNTPLPLANSNKNLTVQKNVPPKIQGQAIHFVGGDFFNLFELRRSHVNSLTIPENFTRIAQAQLIFNRDWCLVIPPSIWNPSNGSFITRYREGWWASFSSLICKAWIIAKYSSKAHRLSVASPEAELGVGGDPKVDKYTGQS